MGTRHVFAAALAGLLLVATGSVAATDSTRARLERFAEGIHALSCTFTQQITDARGDTRPEVHGTLALQAPRQFRWQTLTPQKQLIVADGARVWVYDPELEQVTVRKQSVAEAKSPLTILTDPTRLDDDFTVTDGGTHGGLAWLRLTPRQDDSAFKYAEIGLDGDVPRQMVFTNNLGGESRISFHDWQRNPDLPPGTFQFIPPAGVDVVGDVVVPEINGLRN